MRRLEYLALVLRAWFELARYDVLTTVWGYRAISARCGKGAASNVSRGDAWTSAICDAVAMACCLYWKPVLCLQRSACITWLLHDGGIAARLVIGYRAVPFYAHAWVELEGRVVNDSPAYRQQLRVLHTR